MSKSFFSDLELSPFPSLDDVCVPGFNLISFVNPFVSSGLDGQNYAIFEQLSSLPEASQRKVMVEELLSNPEIFQFFVEHDPVATKCHLELLDGVYKDCNIGEFQKHRVMIVLFSYISKRTPLLFTFLENEIDKVLVESGLYIIRQQSSESLSLLAARTLEVVKILDRRNLTEYDFLKVNNQLSLRRMVYLWMLVAFFAKDFEKKSALRNLKNALSEWAGGE